MIARRPYAECPECGSAAVVPVPLVPGQAAVLLGCTRCGFQAASFPRRLLDPSRFDNRPRLAGMILPTCREDLDA